MTKKRKYSESSPIKMEIKEENISGNDYLMAKGRLNSVLKQLTEQSESDSDSSDGNTQPRKNDSYRKRKEVAPTPYHHTYVMKLFDRSVDLARFEEDTPLYPICRAWMQNQPRNPQSIVKRRVSSPEPPSATWNRSISDVHRLPPPQISPISRIPSPLPEQEQNRNNINLNYEENPPVPKDVLIRNHVQRWVKVKKHWVETAKKNEDRYGMSTEILRAIYNKSQESMEP